jgi:predicted nucleic acid-binding protein
MYAYLDSSALVKLAVREAETDALERTVLERDALFTSVVASMELSRALRRASSKRALLQQLDDVLACVFLAEMTPAIRDRAGRLEPASLRTLDAIHLSTAVDLSLPDLEFVTYDDRQAGAAAALGLRVAQPGR